LSAPLKSLLNLQQVDDHLLDLELKLQQIPARIREVEKSLEEEKQGLESEKRRLKEALLRQRTLDKQLEESVQQINKKESRKFEAKSNEEFWAIEKEIAYAKQAHSKLEDEILTLLDEVETLEKSIERREREIKQREAAAQSEKKFLEEQVVDIDRNHQENRRKREEVCTGLPPDILQVYEKIRAQRPRPVVVVIRAEVCPGCHMHIPPQTINEVLQTGEIRHCPYCRRILYCELLEKPA